MNQLKRNSLRFKYVRTPQAVLDDDYTPYVSSDDDVDQSKAKKDRNDENVFKPPWAAESEPKRKKVTSKMGRLEELNKMIEERMKKMVYHQETLEPRESMFVERPGQFPFRPLGMRWRETRAGKSPPKNESGRRKKDGAAPGTSFSLMQSRKGGEPKKRGLEESNCDLRTLPYKPKQARFAKKPDTGPQASKTDNKGSELSFEKVLGLCRTKLQAMDDHREELLKSIPHMRARDGKKPDKNPNRNESDTKNAKGKAAEGPASEKKQSTSSFISNTFVFQAGISPAGEKTPEQQSSKNKNSVGAISSHLKRIVKESTNQVAGQKPPHKAVAPAKEIDANKTQINEILKGHAQKMSIESIRSSYQLRDGSSVSFPIRKPSVHQNLPPTVKNQSKVDASNGSDHKVRETSPRNDKIRSTHSIRRTDKPPEVEKKPTPKTSNEIEPPRPVEDSVRGRESERAPGKAAEETSSSEERQRQQSETNNPVVMLSKAMSAPETSGVKETDEEPEKRVTYTDRVVVNRTTARRNLPMEEQQPFKVSAPAVATAVPEVCTPFREQEQKAKIAMGRSESAGAKLDSPAKASSARSPSETILLKSMVNSITKPRTDKRESGSGKDQSSKSSDQTIKTKCTRSAELRDLVTQAIKDHKIFCIFDNHSYIVRPVREELLSRGWLEVIPDRRLIPRRRPPPAGPTLDRRSSLDYAVEAVLTAKEAFADDITEILSKSVPVKPAIEKPKISRKISDESLKETVSEFRIVPPSSEKKKNNVEIREFVARFQNAKQSEPKDRGKEKKGKKAEASDDPASDEKDDKSGKKADATDDARHVAHVSSSIQAIIDSLNDNKKYLRELEEKNNDNGDLAEILRQTSSGAGKKDASDEVDSKASKYLLTENESKIASKIIQSSNARIHFMWLFIKPGIHLKCFNYSPEIVNKFQKTTFCTKIGLWSHLNNIQWYAHEVHFPAKSPRMYNTGEADDLQAFFQDFQMTACIGILKWLSETFFDKGIKGVQKKKGKVPIKAFEFAIKQCERYIRFRENEDLNSIEEPKVMQEEWNTFLQWFYIITNDHGKVQETSNAQLMVVYTKAVEILRAMKRHWPEIDVDGRLNIWIMKPYCASCGRGIFMTNNVYYIGQHSKYIVQKYIERPFLIYNTKFDIRQWFMITKLIPLEIWMYKECYLRFCTQPFVLRNLHESVHLSNNSVQRKYVSQKDPTLPDQNMWDSNTFQQYLKTIGQPNAWSEIIYPGMRDAIISIMLASQDTFDSQRRSWFEVYGADFMISANLKDGPWLIEINENPAMDPSTKVTARLCPQMLRDVIKVVVDKRSNKNALTGQWELVYRQNYSPSFGTIDLDVKGKRIARISPSMKSGFSNSSLHPPPFFLSCMNSTSKKDGSIDRDPDTKKQYEIVKSYNAKRGKGTNEGDPERQMRQKPSIWRTRGKGRLMKDNSSCNCMEKPQVQVKNIRVASTHDTNQLRETKMTNNSSDAMVNKFIEVSLHGDPKEGKPFDKEAGYNPKLMEKMYLQLRKGTETREKIKNSTISSFSRRQEEMPGKMGPSRERIVVNGTGSGFVDKKRLTNERERLGQDKNFDIKRNKAKATDGRSSRNGFRLHTAGNEPKNPNKMAKAGFANSSDSKIGHERAFTFPAARIKNR